MCVFGSSLAYCATNSETEFLPRGAAPRVCFLPEDSKAGDKLWPMPGLRRDGASFHFG